MRRTGRPPARWCSTSGTRGPTYASCAPGDPIAARTIRRGGEHLTAAIAKAFNADVERAEQAKRNDAFLVSPGRPATTPLGVKLDSVLREALAPTIRELRQTLASFRASNRFDVDALLVVGGGGRLAGLLPFLDAELGIPARHPAIRPALEAGGARSADVAGEEGAAPESDSYALAAAIAIAAHRGSREIDFRRGPFVYRASFSILRQKGLHMAALAGALLLAGGIDLGARYSGLTAERKALDKDLKTATQELFGQPRDDAEAITQLMKRGFREELAPVPKATRVRPARSDFTQGAAGRQDQARHRRARRPAEEDVHQGDGRHRRRPSTRWPPS